MKYPKAYILITLSLGLCLGVPSTSCADDQPAPKAGAGKSTTELLEDLKKNSEAAADPELKSLGADLGTKVGALNTSLAGNPAAQGQLNGALKGLAGNGGAVGTLTSLQQLSQAKLTPQQTTLAKDVYHTGSAYLVQKNLGSVEGAQSDVAQVVGSLKKGSPVEALPALKAIGDKGKLTQPQKDFLSSLTKAYTPGLQKADDLLKGIPGLGK